MPADTAKYRLSIADIPSENFEVIDFSGCDAIGVPYWFIIHFRMSKISALAPPSDAILGKACRFDLVHNGELIPYCGVVTQFGVSDSDDTCYTIRLAPRMHSLTLNATTRAFQNLTVPEIIKSVVAEAGLPEHFRFEVEPDDVKYPKREYCVQYRETHLAFISRLMEECGLWYRFEQATHSDGTLIERAVVSDEFFRFPSLGRSIPFMKGKGLAEITSDGSTVESVNDISAASTLMPQSVRVRTYNHRTPESAPDAISDVMGGHEGRIYEYGGTARNSSEAERHAELHARRLWVEHSLGEGKSNCASFHAGQCVSIRHKDNDSLEGTYLLVSVKHFGGWDGGAYTYRNEFTCVRAEQEIYALPLRTPIPYIPGVITARIGATGDNIPTLNENGNYKANMLFELGDGQGDTGQNSNDYNGSRHIRRIQFSGGALDDGSYGSHFTSKRGAEVVLAFVNGDPNRPIALGIVPNAANPSVTNNANCTESIIRTWGGNEFVMDDADGNKSVKLSTPGKRSLEMHDGDEEIRLKTDFCELLASDAEQILRVSFGKYVLLIDGKDGKGSASIITANGSIIKLDDDGDIITLQNASEEGGGKVNKAVLNGSKKLITLDSMGNMVTINGKENRLTFESKDSKVAIDGNGEKVTVENKDNRVVVDGGGGSVTVDAKNDINLQSGGQLVMDAKGGISKKGGQRVSVTT